jgi:hypothetical protein
MPIDTSTPKASHHHQTGDVQETLEFLKRTRSELRQLRRVCVWKDRLHVCDVNRDVFEICGLGYLDAEIIPVLDSINAAYDPATIHAPTDAEYKELRLGRCRPWAEDRVM